MTIERVRHHTDPAHHVDHVVLSDHFGHQLDLQIHPFVVRDVAGKPGEYEIVPVDVEAEISKATELMKMREQAYFQHLVKRHPDHPLCLSYPDWDKSSQAKPLTTHGPQQAGAGTPGQATDTEEHKGGRQSTR
jgi:hypothetical protein